MFQTEYPFTLPLGYPDDDGTLHRDGVMRRATAADEILPLNDPRVQKNPAYLIVILLSRVVTRLGTVDARSTRRSSSRCTPPTSRTCRTSTTGSITPGGTGSAELSAVQPRLRGGGRRRGGVLGYPLERLHEEVAFIAYHFHWPHAESWRSSTPTGAMGEEIAGHQSQDERGMTRIRLRAAACAARDREPAPYDGRYGAASVRRSPRLRASRAARRRIAPPTAADAITTRSSLMECAAVRNCRRCDGDAAPHAASTCP